MTNDQPAPTVAVLGLGAMGAALARSIAAAGHPVRAWNRSPKTARDGGGSEHLAVVGSAQAAVTGARWVVACVRDHAAFREVLETVAPHLDGQVVLNLSTGTPVEAAQTAARARELGLRYVTGAVMVPTPLVGTDDCLVLYAGDEPDVAELAPLQRAFGGASDPTGPDHAVPPVLDLAMLDIYFAGMYAHLHATALAAAHGVPPERFLPYARGIVDTLGGSLADLTASVERRTYDQGEARLDMCLSFLEHIVATSRAAGIAPGLAERVRDASARALEQHSDSTDWDVVAEDFQPVRKFSVGASSAP